MEDWCQGSVENQANGERDQRVQESVREYIKDQIRKPSVYSQTPLQHRSKYPLLVVSPFSGTFLML
jgi:hypothetical protein